MSDTTTVGPQGIGGWLILVILGLILTPLMVGHSLLTELLPVFSNGTWQLLTTPGTEVYHPMWAPLIIFETVGNLALVVLAIVTLISLLSKSSRTPTLAIIYFAGGLIFVVSDIVFANLIPSVAAQSDAQDYKDMARAAVSAAIWIPYFRMSKRVKATFVG